MRAKLWLPLSLFACSTPGSDADSSIELQPADEKILPVPKAASDLQDDQLWWPTVKHRLDNELRAWQPRNGSFQSSGRDNETYAIAEEGRLRLIQRHNESPLDLRFLGVVRGDYQWQAVPVMPRLDSCGTELQEDVAGGCLSRIAFEHEGMTEWWISEAQGWRQGWDIFKRPEGPANKPIDLVVSIEGATDIEIDGLEATLWVDSQLWRINSIAAWDAHGVALPVWLEAEDQILHLMVDDRKAVYPILVDPLFDNSAYATRTGAVTGDYFGYAISRAGDVNGDGYEDVIIGAPYNDTPGTDAGRAYIYHGSSSGPVSSASTTLSPVAVSGKLGTYFGYAVAGGGDFNNDGYDDVVVGMTGGQNSSGVDTGRVITYHGSSSGVSSTAVRTLYGSATGDEFGHAVAVAGNINNDNYDDIIIGAPYYGASSIGIAYVYKGAASGIASSASTTLNGAANNDYFGTSVAGGCDVNNDNYDDVIVGAYGNDQTAASAGAAYIYHGSSTVVSSTATTSIYGAAASDSFGYDVACVGKANNDAYDDVAVDAPYNNYGGKSDSGAVYIYHGGVSGADTTKDTTLGGTTANAWFGYNIASARTDINDDGYNDILITVLNDGGAGSGKAEVQIFEGSSTGISTTVASTITSGVSASGFGLDIAAADANGDGFDDLFIGNHYTTKGNVYFYRGDGDHDGDGYNAGSDCDDTNAAIHPGATEVAADGVDQDCDGSELCYDDADGDGYGTTTTSNAQYLTCLEAGEPISNVSTDCDDTNSAIKPGATELTGDQVDQNCDSAETCYVNADNDGYRLTSTVASADTDCTDSGEGKSSLPTTDCNDTSAAIYPGATELTGDSVDQNCDGAETCYTNADGDAYGIATTKASTDTDCTDAGEGSNATDCDDTSSAIYPGATELTGDEVDQNCDGAETCYVNADNDSHRLATTVASADTDCTDSGEAKSSVSTTDCDDTSSAIYPGATEVAGDEVDQNCDGAESCYEDLDGDTFGTSSTVASVDTDCDDAGESTLATDCDDTAAAIKPGVAEVAGDEVDQNCDNAETCYVNADNDSHRLATTVASADTDCTDSGEGKSSLPTTDCNDTSSAIYPGATEVAGDEVDQNCDGAESCYEDLDGDTFGTSSTVASVDTDCDDAGESTLATDCDDTAAAIKPGVAEVAGDEVDQNCDGAESCYADADADSYRTGSTVASANLSCADTGEAASSVTSGDCDDTDSDIKPGATEIAGDEIDQDCDGAESCYEDLDGDTFGTSSTVASVDTDCDDAGESTLATDCDDTAVAIKPGVAEVAGDEVDQNCDGAETCYVDADGDSFRTASTVASANLSCADTGEAASSATDGDCDDTDSNIKPGATEVAGDEIDQDCDGAESCYEDLDGDTFGTSSTVASVDTDCDDAGESTLTTDCDDTAAAIKPGVAEVTGDEVDQNCDGAETCYVDADADSYRTASTVASADLSCADTGEAASSVTDGDCDDSDNAINPGAAEIAADEVDQDCNGSEECYDDGDSDGYGTTSTMTSADTDCDDSGEAILSTDCDDNESSVYPGATEVVGDEIDQDCDTQETCYADADADGFRINSTVVSTDSTCQDSGEAAASITDGDCDDSDSAVNPDATEVTGDELDQNCDGDEDCYVDGDADGYRTGDTVASTGDLSCEDAGEATAALTDGDCDDAEVTVYPGATEVVGDEIDQDCDGFEECYEDLDEDSYRTDDTITSSDASCNDTGAALASDPDEDCDDDDEDIYPGATEVSGNGIDEDCDGSDLGGVPDAEAPIGTVEISGVTTYVSAISVTLDLSATDNISATKMCISNTNTCGGVWENYATTKSWNLTAGNGSKTVYAWFKDAAGNISVVASDTAILDATAPTTGSLNPTAGNDAVLLQWSGFSDAGSGLAGFSVRYDTDPIVTCADGTLANTYGAGATGGFVTGLTGGQLYYFAICATDLAGNVASPVTTSETPTTGGQDTLAPVGTITIASGAAYTRVRSVTLTLAAEDDVAPTQMCISNTTTCTAWETYATSKAWTLTIGDAVKTVYVKFRDADGNTSSAYTDTIRLDTFAPKAGIMSYTAGYLATTISWIGFSDVSGIASYKLVAQLGNAAPRNCSSGTVVGTTTGASLTHSGLVDGKTYAYRLCALDNAGNWSNGITGTYKARVDWHAPTGSVVLALGSDYIDRTSTNVAITGTDDVRVTHYCVTANTSSCLWKSWGSGNPNFTFNFGPTTNGADRTIYVKFKDNVGNMSPWYTDTVTYIR